MRVQLQPAYVLHTQAYSNTSLILDVFSLDFGRIRLLARGVRSAKSMRRALLQAFTPLNISWTGRSDLKTLTDVELDANSHLPKLQGDGLFNGLYVNELLIKLTHANDPHEDIFFLYKNVIEDLSGSQDQAFSLRCFEYQLLEFLGYGLAIESIDDLSDGTKIYQYQPEAGLVLHSGGKSALPLIEGRYLLSLLQKEICGDEGMQQLKNLMRFTLHYHLDGKKIQSRVLYQ